MPIRAAVIGLGIAGVGFHVPLILSLQPLFTLAYVVDTSAPPELENGTFADKFGTGTQYLARLEDVLTKEDVDLIVVATPTATHYNFAKSALEAGKHVLLDKPVTVSYSEAQSLGVIAKQRNRVLYAFQNRRWDSDYLTLQQLIRQGRLGNITDYESHYDRYRNFLKGSWKESAIPGGGQFYSLGPHLIDQALKCFGRPDKVTAFIKNIRGTGDPKVDDDFTVILHYLPTRSKLHTTTATLRGHLLSARKPQLRFIVRGSKATYSKYGFDAQEGQMQHDGHRAFNREDFGVEPEELWGTLETAFDDKGNDVRSEVVPSIRGSYQELYRNLADVIETGAEPAVKWEEAELTMLITELAIQSSREERTVTVPSLSTPTLSPVESNEADLRRVLEVPDTGEKSSGSSAASTDSPPSSIPSTPSLTSPKRSMASLSPSNSAWFLNLFHRHRGEAT